MNEPTSERIDRLNVTQLRTLLRLLNPAQPEPAGLSAQTVRPEELARLLTHLTGKIRRSGEVLLEEVRSPETPVATLRHIKEQAKTLRKAAQTKPHRDAAAFLYHASVAAAYAFHGKEISSQPISQRLGHYDQLGKILETHSLGQVFRRAVARRRKAG